ncbi:MAG: hypothetical protein M3O25_03160 [Actinomycetota bacterium]|nr:hypothetical protein [Actinomycetota bacterium]
MLLAKIVCSDPDCTEELEIAVDRLVHLDGYTCECGHGFVLVSVSERRQPSCEIVSIATRATSTGTRVNGRPRSRAA